MLYTWAECVSFVGFLAMAIIMYYHLYLAGIKMDEIEALF